VPQTKRRPRPKLDPTPVERTDTGSIVHQEGWTEYIPAHELEIDERYQRDINYPFVTEIAENLDFALLQTIGVARRPGAKHTCECGKVLDHRNFVIDGQHRVMGVKSRGLENLGLPCTVRLSQGSDWEADQYLRINFNRKNPTSTARYKAAVHAGETHGWVNEAEVAAMLDKLGIEAARSTSAATFGNKSHVPAILLAIGAVCRFHLSHPDLIDLALATLRDAWGERYGNAYDSVMIGGMMDFFGAHETEVAWNDVVPALAKFTPDDLRDQAEQMRGNRKYPVRVCVARIVAESYNANKRGDRRVREVSPVQYSNVLRVRAGKDSLAANSAKGRAASAAIPPEQRSARTRKGWNTRRNALAADRPVAKRAS
jgi:hypothetical protein